MANESVSTSNIWPNYSTQNVQKAAAKSSTESSTMGKEQFLTILVAQLKNQDPLSPMDNSQFTAQMAQFSSLEQLMNMSAQLTQMNSSMGTASQLIGQKITWYDGDTSNYLTGNVSSVLQKDGKMYAAVGDYLVATSDITMVEPASAGATASAASISQTAAAADTAKTDSGKSTETAESAGAVEEKTAAQSSTQAAAAADDTAADTQPSAKEETAEPAVDNGGAQ
ncbi:flagellar hook capping FlgD N-terminal domain-containing protein [Saccharibacillus sp. CPCC 101409]|uniref:flagellar hook capping FlgD N-terminal domain-containing protein n=1 Tax=Saccharibacillus sp. CPCC 101409 TaxID=3058041 RepID=UPI002673AB3C|nr:flagellar hook capping FlgD N-terminal domain-containing protein [Saccharibacillus sp. CPCC 101409]MDO3410697.1 flagellar hook capping FlgD N-terminal domain-containing protein [Saccharibacillus sp. CPCC 101409]